MNNLNNEEKEAIDTLQNCIADYVIGDFCVGKYCPQEDVCKNDDCPFEKAIDIVLNLIDKQQKEKEDLYEVIEEWVNGERYNDIFYVSKDKIKAKIKELEKEEEEKQEYGCDFTLIHEHEIDTNAIIQVLKELLGEE